MIHATIKDYLLNEYELDTIRNIEEHGCSGGVSGLTYYTETCFFHDQFEEEIWNMLWDDAVAEGCSILELITRFNGQKNVGSMGQFKNMLCWYAVERTARNIIEEQENA